MPRRLATECVAFGVAAIVNLIGCASRDVPPAPPNQLTFEQRCADPATVKCVGFDSPAEVDRFVYLPYQTGKDPARRHSSGYTWYDELVISRSRIADPA